MNVTPAANTSTPSHGAQSPSWSLLPVSTRTDATPAASMPARMPNASRASCTAPVTRRLEPDTICPAASSTTDVANVAPGRNTTSEATMARERWVDEVVAHGERGERRHRERGEDGEEHPQVRSVGGDLAQHTDDDAERGAGHEVARCRIEDEGQADRQDAVTEDPDQGPEPGGGRADRDELGQSVLRIDGATGGGADETVDGRELIEAERATERGRELEHHGLAGAHRDHEVRGEALTRAPGAP